MAKKSPILLQQFIFSVRFVQGYRYLDRCGEALIKLEESLYKGWIPGEISPARGTILNYVLGMTAQFQSESLTVQQNEHLSFGHFENEACKIYEILWSTFGIKRIIAPAFRTVWQAGFENVDDSERFIESLHLCAPSPAIMRQIGGKQSAFSFALVTEASAKSEGLPQRRRLEVKGVRQEKQPDFDSRVMQRFALLPREQRVAMEGLRELRRRHPIISPSAAQFDTENSLDGELSVDMFNLAEFLQQSWQWTQMLMGSLNGES